MQRTIATMQQGISNMRSLTVTRLIFAFALCSAAAGHGTDSCADPLLTQGVGIANCGKLANDLKPSQGDAKKVEVSEKDAFNPWEQ
jgi:hypothetical protein